MQIVVWESRPWWTPRLQRRFVGSEIAVRGVSAMRDVVETVADMVILDAAADPETMVRSCVVIRRRHPGTFVMVIVPPDLQAAEWRLREIGAGVVVRDDIGGDELARLCRHVLQTAPGNGSTPTPRAIP